MSTELEFDVVVLGTGAAGLTAALSAAVLGASVGVFEKAPTVGGTTAVSGGLVWVPLHDLPDRNGPLTYDDARRYLDSLSLGLMDAALSEALIREGQNMIEFVESNSPVRFEIADGFPDYYPENPGGRPHGGRSLNPSPYSFDELGPWASRITSFPTDSMTFGFDVETRTRLRLRADDATLESMAKVNGKFMGAGLVGGLLRALLDRGIEPYTSSPAVQLIENGGRITGVVVEQGGRRVNVIARGGVVIATGGFEWDERLTKAFLRGPMRGPVSPPYNTGDGLKMAMAVGADLGNMGDAWWVPVIQAPGDTFLGQPRSRSIRLERTRPRSIIVNSDGQRFVNEAMNYNSMATAFHEYDLEKFDYRNLPAWLIVDSTHLTKYDFLGVPAGGERPEWFNESKTLEELSDKTDINVEGLRQTLKTWNADVAAGRDSAFHRGDSAHDGWWGDWDAEGNVQRTLGPIDTAPYYAVPVTVGSLGTKGGPRTNNRGQVLHVNGELIPGLYAAGNAMAAPTAYAYGGAGGTLGPAMTFGFLAGQEAARSTTTPGDTGKEPKLTSTASRLDPSTRLEILDLYARQSHAIDASDGEAWAATYTVDGTFTTPTYGRTVRGREELAEFARSSNDGARARGEQFRHVITNVVMTVVAEDRINSAAYLTITATSKTASRIDRSVVLEDELHRVDGQWLVASRFANRDE